MPHSFNNDHLPHVAVPAVLMDLLEHNPMRCATISEYAVESGLGVPQVLTAFSRFLEEGSLVLEPVGDEIFVQTRPQTQGYANVIVREFPPNLWAEIASRRSQANAYGIWMLIRDMERAGWNIEARPAFARYGLGPTTKPPVFGIFVQNAIIPVSVYPDREALLEEKGVLASFEAAGATSIAVVCSEGALDETVTTVREWMLAKTYQVEMSVLVLEEPRYEPILVRSDDGSVTPHAVNYLADPRHTQD